MTQKYLGDKSPSIGLSPRSIGLSFLVESNDTITEVLGVLLFLENVENSIDLFIASLNLLFGPLVLSCGQLVLDLSE